MIHEYSEREAPFLRSGLAFLLSVILLFIVGFSTVFLRSLELETVWPDAVVFVLCCVFVYLLHRYTAITHLYLLDGETFGAVRTSGRRKKMLFSCSGKELKLICPETYTGNRIPRGDFSLINASVQPRKRKTGWLIYAVTSGGVRQKLRFFPSPTLLANLAENFPDKCISVSENNQEAL